MITRPRGRRLFAATLATLVVAGGLTWPTSTASAASTGIDLPAPATDLVFSPDGSRAYVSSGDDGLVTVVDTTADRVVGAVALGRRIESMALSRDGRRLLLNATSCYDASEDSMRIRVVDTSTLQVSKTALAMYSCTGDMVISPDDRTVYTGGGAIEAWDIASGRLKARRWVGGNELELSRDGRQLFARVHSWNEAEIVRFDTSTLALAGSAWTYGYQRGGMALTPDGTRIVTNEWTGWQEFAIGADSTTGTYSRALEGVPVNESGDVDVTADGSRFVIAHGSSVITAALASGRVLAREETGMAVSRVFAPPRGEFAYAISSEAPRVARVSLPAPSWTKAPAVSRVAGTDRYDTAIQVSRHSYPEGAEVVYLATGADFPDALSAAPAAAKERGPLLLIPPGRLPQDVAAEIRRLAPTRVVLIGGSSIMTSQVRSDVGRLAGRVDWVHGGDRYQTSDAIRAYAWKEPSEEVYVADGRGFADAVGGGAAAGSRSAPLILVPGSIRYEDPRFTGLTNVIAATGYDRVAHVLGGEGAVGVVAFAHLFHSTVAKHRLWGMDRYATSRYVNGEAFPTARRAYLAVGTTYPDALAGSAAAGAAGSPLYIVPPTCVPRAVLDDMAMAGVSEVVLLGGTGSLAPSVAALTPCRGS